MRPLPRTVPWTSFNEFEQVYKWLYEDTEMAPELVELGIERVRAWSTRGNIPRAVESTAAFAQVRLRDRKGLGGHWLSQHELRMMYAMAFVRFVNGIVDPAQTSTFALSIAAIAERLGLPLWFVELRHAGTHEHLPSLSVLRDGCDQALGWIHEFYWDITLKPEATAELSLETMNIVKAMLNDYKETRKAFLKELKSNARPDKTPMLNSLNKILRKMSPDMAKQGVVSLLVGIGGMVPAGKKKRASIENMSISEDLIKLWKPLIQELSSHFPGFEAALLATMMERIDVNSDFVLNEKLIYPSYGYGEEETASEDTLKTPSYLLTLTCWLRYFVEDSVQKSDRLFEGNILDDIVESCLRKPNYYTRSVLQAATTVDPELATSLKPFIQYIDRMLRANNKKSTETTDSIMEDESMKNELDTLSKQLQLVYGKTKSAETTVEANVEQDNASPWGLYDASAWKSCPIGCLPNGTVPCLDLPIAMEEN
ncbi:Las1-like-domain-containing protein [Phycomyces blakesleeanus]|uniref:Las1-like-domain-containing protein n=1 Tax=Phycomyces blakesleeanus TaxID=4837 RepID=A0ABR3B3B6_PHYBL